MTKAETKAWLNTCRVDLCWLKYQITTGKIHAILRERASDGFYPSGVSGSFVKIEYDSVGNLQGTMRYTDNRLKRLMIYMLRDTSIILLDGGYLR
jgi:hypothetical protein